MSNERPFTTTGDEVQAEPINPPPPILPTIVEPQVKPIEKPKDEK